MVIWTLAKKELRLLVRDARALVILLAMPIIFILVLGVSLGEGFGQKAADRLRVSVLNLDEGLPRFFDRQAMLRDGLAWLSATPLGHHQGAAGLSLANRREWFPDVPWSELVLRDLTDTADIRVEYIRNREEAEQLVRSGKRAAIMILGPSFSKRVARCSFLAAGWRDALFLARAYPRPGDPVVLALAATF